MTYSIVARDPETGEMGVAVQSHWFSVGSVVSWGRAGVGVVATQALAEASYGPRGLALMASGVPAPDALAELLAADDSRDVRQVAMVDSEGRVAAHTGSRCIAAAGHATGDGFSCQANMMWSATVWGAMSSGFAASRGPLSDRLMAALTAAEAEGGDIRGRQSAAILVVGAEATGDVYQDRPLDLRIEDHPDPITEMRRLLRLHRAYYHMSQFDEALEQGDQDKAWRHVAAGESLIRDNMEIIFWKAVELGKLGRIDEARELMERCATSHPGWPELLGRLPAAGLFPDDRELVKQMLDFGTT